MTMNQKKYDIPEISSDICISKSISNFKYICNKIIEENIMDDEYAEKISLELISVDEYYFDNKMLQIVEEVAKYTYISNNLLIYFSAINCNKILINQFDFMKKYNIKISKRYYNNIGNILSSYGTNKISDTYVEMLVYSNYLDTSLPLIESKLLMTYVTDLLNKNPKKITANIIKNTTRSAYLYQDFIIKHIEKYKFNEEMINNILFSGTSELATYIFKNTNASDIICQSNIMYCNKIPVIISDDIYGEYKMRHKMVNNIDELCPEKVELIINLINESDLYKNITDILLLKCKLTTNIINKYIDNFTKHSEIGHTYDHRQFLIDDIMAHNINSILNINNLSEDMLCGLLENNFAGFFLDIIITKIKKISEFTDKEFMTLCKTIDKLRHKSYDVGTGWENLYDKYKNVAEILGNINYIGKKIMCEKNLVGKNVFEKCLNNLNNKICAKFLSLNIVLSLRHIIDKITSGMNFSENHIIHLLNTYYKPIISFLLKNIRKFPKSVNILNQALWCNSHKKIVTFMLNNGVCPNSESLLIVCARHDMEKIDQFCINYRIHIEDRHFIKFVESTTKMDKIGVLFKYGYKIGRDGVKHIIDIKLDIPDIMERINFIPDEDICYYCFEKNFFPFSEFKGITSDMLELYHAIYSCYTMKTYREIDYIKRYNKVEKCLIGLKNNGIKPDKFCIELMFIKNYRDDIYKLLRKYGAEPNIQCLIRAYNNYYRDTLLIDDLVELGIINK